MLSACLHDRQVVNGNINSEYCKSDALYADGTDLHCAALAVTAATGREADTAAHRKRTRAERSVYPGDTPQDSQIAAQHAEALPAAERAQRAAAALADACGKVAERRTVRKQRRDEQRQR